MKTLIAAFAALVVLCFAGAWLTERFGGADARVNMDALPLEILGLVFLALDLGLIAVYALYRLLFT